MYPYSEQNADNNVPPAYSSAGEPPSSAQVRGDNFPSAYDPAQSSAYYTPMQTGSASAQSLTVERRGLIEDLVAYPGRSVRSLCQPGLRTFARETLNARWDVVWISIFALPLLSSLIALLLGMAGHHITSGMLGGILLSPLIVIPILFFIIQGMIWPLARHYRGGGTFLEQCFTTFLPLAPLFLLGSVVSILLAINPNSRITGILVLLELLLFIYSSILLVVSLKAIHGLTTWEAFTLALLPMFSILAVLVIVLIFALMIAANNNNSSSNGSSGGSGSSGSSGSSGEIGISGGSSGSNLNTYQQPYYRNNYWWWWWGPRYASNNMSQSSQHPQILQSPQNLQNPRLKIQWFCPTCKYCRWMRQGPAELACVRCGEFMQPTEATR